MPQLKQLIVLCYKILSAMPQLKQLIPCYKF
jgi:hypothetical protein